MQPRFDEFEKLAKSNFENELAKLNKGIKKIISQLSSNQLFKEKNEIYSVINSIITDVFKLVSENVFNNTD